MDQKTITISTSRLIILFVLAVLIGGGLIWGIIYIAQNGFPKIIRNSPDIANMTIHPTTYNDVYRFVENRISVKGYIIIGNDTSNICGTIGWSNCKVWFDDDPMKSGLGLHEAKINIGEGQDQITVHGDLYDHGGNRLKITRTDQYGWYYVQITGYVESCKGRECSILVDGIYALH